MPQEQAKNTFSQLVSGMAHLHAHGVAHLDLKPDNLLMGEDGQIKISDFGLSAI